MTTGANSNILAEPGAIRELAGCRLNSEMRNPNLFLLPKGGGYEPSGALGHLLCERLRCEFPIRACDLVLTGPAGTASPAEFLCIAIDSSRPEKVRDTIKERLWSVRLQGRTRTTFADVLSGRHEKTGREFRLEEYGVFIPCKTRKFGAIRIHSFEHSPAFYRYRVALARMARLPPPLADYLHGLFTDCPNHLFRRSAFRASAARRGGLGVEIPLSRVKRHDIIALAGESRGVHAVKSRHENLQKFFLERNPNSVACEVPVWLESWEFDDYPRVLKTHDSLTGHIDLLRQEDDGLLGVWDYKPQAARERDAGVQVFLYALMLSLRTGLPMRAFLCGYFDEKEAYLFRPSQVKLTRRA